MDMPETSTPSRLQQSFVQLRDDLQQCIIGQPHLIDCLLVALLADGHLLVEGAPGLAKTTAVKALAARIEADFHRVQFTPDLLPADLTGTDVFRPQSGSFEFERGPLFHNIILADEINRAPAKVQSALLEAMAEQQITVGRSTWQLPELFMVMATQNPIEQEGTFTLPEAQLDRFLMHVTIGYPDAVAELAILKLAREQASRRAHPVAAPPALLSQSDVFAARDAAMAVHMAPALEEYLTQLVLATPRCRSLRAGTEALDRLGRQPARHHRAGSLCTRAWRGWPAAITYCPKTCTRSRMKCCATGSCSVMKRRPKACARTR